jgi:hypothetical protein
MNPPEGDDALAAVPLFPLPNVVLFPRAILPLQVLEERYKAMTADVLAGDRLIAIALLKPGWEKTYYQRPAIQPVVCVGEILTHEQLPNGEFNFLLQGRMRARIVREYPGKRYRLAALAALSETNALEIDLEQARGRLVHLFSEGMISRIAIGRQFSQLLHSSLPTADIADLAAFNLLDDVDLKQLLLSELDVRRRVQQLVEALETWSARVNPGLYGFPVNPGVN